MSLLSVAPRSAYDSRIAGVIEPIQRRIEAMPPGTCPLAVQVALLEAGGAQTCGKCVPCRDGIPQLAAMMRKVLNCEADEATLDALRELAGLVRDTSDCAIGYEAGKMVLPSSAITEGHLTRDIMGDDPLDSAQL